jgi:hypothetical protein
MRTKLDQPIGHIRPKAGAPITSPANPYHQLLKEHYEQPPLKKQA